MISLVTPCHGARLGLRESDNCIPVERLVDWEDMQSSRELPHSTGPLLPPCKTRCCWNTLTRLREGIHNDVVCVCVFKREFLCVPRINTQFNRLMCEQYVWPQLNVFRDVFHNKVPPPISEPLGMISFQPEDAAFVFEREGSNGWMQQNRWRSRKRTGIINGMLWSQNDLQQIVS